MQPIAQLLPGKITMLAGCSTSTFRGFPPASEILCSQPPDMSFYFPPAFCEVFFPPFFSWYVGSNSVVVTQFPLISHISPSRCHIAPRTTPRPQPYRLCGGVPHFYFPLKLLLISVLSKTFEKHSKLRWGFTVHMKDFWNGDAGFLGQLKLPFHKVFWTQLPAHHFSSKVSSALKKYSMSAGFWIFQ